MQDVRWLARHWQGQVRHPPVPTEGKLAMTYVGDFPPCTHKFVNSNGVVLCEYCGALSQANRSTRVSTASNG